MTILKPLGYAAALSVTTVFGLTAATQYVAWQLNFDAALGQPFGYLGRIPWYSPLGIIDWFHWRDQLAIIDTGLFLGLVCIVIPFAILIRLVRPKPATFGRTIWATAADIKRAGLLRRKPGGTILGKLTNGRLLSYDGDEHQMVVGASRSGKTAGFVIPTLLTWLGSVVIFDPKRELYAITARFRQHFGHAFYLDFTDPNSACFNPLDEIRIGTVHETADVQNIVAVIVDPGGSKDSLDYWEKDCSQLFLGVILFVLYGNDQSRKNLAAIRDLLLDLPALLMEMQDSPHAEVRKIGASFATMPQKQLFGVKATADAALIIYADPLVAEKTSRSDFRISDLVCLDNPRSLYIQLPPSDANRLRPLSRLILSQIATLMMEDLNTVRGLGKKHKLMMMIDEFATLGRLDCFTSWIRVMASYGLRAVLILQSDRDLADTYGPYNTISENCPVQVLFPTSDDSTLRRISTAIGNDDENRESRTYPRWFSPGKSSKSVSERRRPVLEPAEIRSMPKDEQLILITTCKPVRCKKIRWWMDKPFQSRGINTFEGGTAPPQHPAILKMAQAARRPEAVPPVEQEAQEPDKTAIAAAAIPRVEQETQPTDEITTVSESPTPQHQDNPLAAVVDRIGWTKTATAKHLFPAESPDTVRRWMSGARRLPDEHLPFITHLLETVANRSESKTDPASMAAQHRCRRRVPHRTPAKRRNHRRRNMKHTIAIQRESAALWHSLGGDVAEALEDPLVTDLLLNADGKLWVDRTGHGRSFTGATIDVHEANSILRLLAHHAGVPVTRDCPLVSATLPGTGERFAGTMPPTTERPTFAIRKPPAKTFGLEAFLADAADTAAVTPDDESAGHPHATALTRAVAAKKNILIAGSTGSGKTSLLSCLLALPSVQADRCLVLEDTQEILIEAPDSVRMLTSSTITMRDLVRQCLRYRPDRLILGEVRGTEALDLVFALNTGHGGSFSTIHANSAEDAIARLEDLCSTAAVNVPRRAIATAFQCIAFVRRTAQGRRIEEVLNVSGFDAASGRYLTTSTH